MVHGRLNYSLFPPLCHYGYVCVYITYLGGVELPRIIHVVNSHLAVGEKDVALDLPRQQKVIFRGTEKTRLMPTLPILSNNIIGMVMVDGSLRSSCEPPASSW